MPDVTAAALTLVSERPQHTGATMSAAMNCQVRLASNLNAQTRWTVQLVRPASPPHRQHGRGHRPRQAGSLASLQQHTMVLSSRMQAKASTDSNTVGGPGQDDEVPTTLPQALRVFFSHPSTILALTFITSLAILRSSYGPVQLQEVIVVVVACATWIAQEWAIHRYLLHSSFSWLGKQIHEAHHAQPYHHVSIDTPPVVAGFMAAASGLAWLVLHGEPALVCSACVSYFTTGLLSYQLVHYLVHTKWVPQSPYMREIRQHHMRHHMRNHDYWFAFSAPHMDALFGTLPAHPGNVPLKIIPRAAVPSAAGGAVSCQISNSSSSPLSMSHHSAPLGADDTSITGAEAGSAIAASATSQGVSERTLAVAAIRTHR